MEETKTAEEQLIRDLIDKYMNFKSGAESTSIQHYGEYGAVSGSLFLNVKAMMREFANHQLTQQQEINAELKETCLEYSNFVRNQTDEISELKKQNAELMDRLTKAESIIKSYYARIDHDDPANRNQIERLKTFIQNTPPKN